MLKLFNLKAYIQALYAFFVVLFRHRQLAWALARRDITDRYVGQALGAVWAFIHPMLLMGIYIFLFMIVFKIRVGVRPGMPDDYALYIICGMVPWLALQDSTNRGVTALSGNASLVKQVVFPIELLPFKISISSLLPMACGIGVLFVYMLVRYASLPATLLLLPLLILFQLALMVGINLLTSPVGCYLRDLKDIIQVFFLVMMYLLPIFYLPDMVPAALRPLLTWNPFSHLIWCWQDVFFFQRIAHPVSWGITIGLSLFVLALGNRGFDFFRTQLGNVL
jgi:lipopolysaccharide transport system permease protein